MALLSKKFRKKLSWTAHYNSIDKRILQRTFFVSFDVNWFRPIKEYTENVTI